ncbi:hypothetical protein TVAG_248540 [Trichomonas vaginalis G3]|uniref:HECT-type E3 ubiquitin transferase n=1 Tax=Trichomonas vaginalis (strain ATCC PRA-98 / G3) TaxID=412133 RepID=A2E790_TRIV3|nr:negative regulation of histone ubiquitination [Trichomonas vaginalis G3]EAY11487.1 hypothetical protein TVAG_248540 [Trichomonas vaginalis G3]KAI5526751.1 negative regulation of histone ubiquitination [Trichomonas vaginalis G3]|eukprot:XP_001323710.1 hypothetical protein [Trichomonas vaginalis G3]
MDNLQQANVFNQLLMQLNNKQADIVKILRELSLYLSYSQNISSQLCPFDKICTALLNILKTNTIADVTDPATLCLLWIVESQPQYIKVIFAINGFAILASRLLDWVSVQTAENCIRIFDKLTDFSDFSTRIGQMIGIEPFLKYIDKISSNEQATAMKIVLRITNSYVKDSFIPYLSTIVSFLLCTEQSIHEPAVTVLNNIASRVPEKSISKDVIVKICTAISHSDSTDIITQLFGALVNLSTTRKHIQCIILANLDFDKILFNPYILNNSVEFQRLIFKLLLNLLPVPKNAELFLYPRHRRPVESRKFAIDVQPIIIKVITERPLFARSALLALAATLTVQPFSMNENLLASLVSFAPISSVSPIVLSILTYFEDLQMIADSDIVSSLKNVPIVDDSIKQWYQRTVKNIMKKIDDSTTSLPISDLKSKNLPAIIDYIIGKPVSKFAFISSDLLDLCIRLVSSDNNDVERLKKLQEYTVGILSFLQPAPLGAICTTDSFSRIAQKPVFVTVISPTGEQYPLSVFAFDSMASIEGRYNSVVRGFNSMRLPQIISSNSELQQLIEINQTLKPSKIALLYRAFSSNSYPKVHMQVADRFYSWCDSIFSALCDTSEGPQNIFDTGLLIKILDGDIEQSPPSLKSQPNQKNVQIFELLLRLQFFTGESIANTAFNARIMNCLSEPLASVGRFSSEMATIYKYPSFFDFKMRFMWLKFATFEPLSAIRIFSREFHIPLQSKIPEPQSVKIFCHRKSIFTDGVLIMRHFGPNMMNLNVSFFGETESGAGPTREFYSLLAKEFTRTKRHFFRTENPNSEFVSCKQGLFINPSADPQMFYVLGVFLAKVIQQEFVVDLDFNPAFFSFIRSPQVSIDLVDAELARALMVTEGLLGLPFTYPGLPNIELVDGGKTQKVSEDNVDEFVELVMSYTSGLKLVDHADAFRKGFNSVMSWNTFEIFDENEICRIIRGDDPFFTRDDLKKNIVAGIGYTFDSPQIGFFIDILCELPAEEQRLVLSFMTGFTRFPPGGLSSISPKITVNMRFMDEGQLPNNELPTVSTCSHIIKIPEYETKEIMKSKLLYACRECETGFNI